MEQSSLRSYNAVIKHVLLSALELAQQAKDQPSLAGFFQLQGPTGGGKSSALYRHSAADNIPASLEVIKQHNLQAILVTHRWNILHDIYHSTVAAKDAYEKPYKLQASILYAQDESIISAVTQTPLPHEHAVTQYDLPNPFEAIEQIDSLKAFSDPTEKQSLIGDCRTILALSKSVRFSKNNTVITTELLEHGEQRLRKVCASVERKLLRAMKRLEKNFKQSKNSYGKDHPLSLQAKKYLNAYRQNPWIRRIFPAIVWRDDKQHLLIMTTQKLFFSFYDGRRKVRMSSNNLSGYVIFIDEFDYQADILQSLLAQAQLVQEPPECIGQLLEGGKRLLARMQFVSTPPIPQLHQELTNLIQNLENDLIEKGINLLDSRALVAPLEQYKAGMPFGKKYLFRSDHLVTSEPLNIKQVEHGFEVSTTNDNSYESVSIADFLRLMEQYIRRFSLILSEFSSDESEANEYLSQFNHLLFDSANDYRQSYYSTALPNMALFALPKTSLIELDKLRESNLLSNSHANIYGLTTWLLKPNESEANIDPMRIEIKRAFMPTTPEGLLVSLASRNLVFALSATSHIERALGHFDLRWVESALRYIAQARSQNVEQSFLGDKFHERPEAWFHKPIPYVQSDNERYLQLDMVKAVIQQKKNIRKTKLKPFIHSFSNALNTEEFNELKACLAPDFFTSSSDEMSIFTQDYRSDVLLKLLHILKLASQSPNHKGHLAFVNSIKYFRKWLTAEEALASRRSLLWFKDDKAFHEQLPSDHILVTFSDIFIPVIVDESKMLLCLLNAESQKRDGFTHAYQSAFDTDRTVIILTQTASSTNGINLDYYLPETSSKMDLTCLYILEAKHFYFSKFAGEQGIDDMSHAGFQLRNLEKLLRAGEISRKQHRNNIMPLMTNSATQIADLNKLYKRTEDFIKNTAADVQQQVGRVERAWAYVPEIEVHICNNIANSLQCFASLPTYVNNRDLISDLNRQLLDTLLNKAKTEQGSFWELMTIKSQTGSKAVEIIDNQLIPALRKARLQADGFKLIESIWHGLGRAILQYDLSWKPESTTFGIESEIKHWACFERPIESLKTQEIWYDPHTWQFFAQRAERRKRYNPQLLYLPIQRHQAIGNWFNRKGYRTSLHPYANELEERYALHPVVVQRILQGRLGEEAIRALLFSHSIDTHQSVDDYRLLELYDFSISGTRFRVDAKYWASETLDAADETLQQWIEAGQPAGTEPLGLIKKIQLIQAVESKNTVLIIANLITKDNDCSLSGFTCDLKRIISIEKAEILVLSGCLSSKNYEVTSGFKHLVMLLKNQGKGEQL